MSAHKVADRRRELDLGNRLMQQDQTALLRLAEAIGGRVASDQHRGNAFVVLGLQALDGADAVLTVA